MKDRIDKIIVILFLNKITKLSFNKRMLKDFINILCIYKKLYVLCDI